MASRPLNDEEVLNEMNKMVAFIKQEAFEKAREIRVKADEEFAIEKAKLVKQKQQDIDASFDKKRKSLEVAQKIAQSTLTNKSRLKLLHKREDVLQDLFAAARSDLRSLSAPLSSNTTAITTGDPTSDYAAFLEAALLQALLQLADPTAELSVHVQTRPRDASLVQDRAAPAAAAAYARATGGAAVRVAVEPVLSDDSAGGVKLMNATRRISIDNTLDERMRLLEEKMLPEIRYDLFGANQNRKFHT